MFDAIVIGSGMSGGIAAKELCERGLKTLVIERGRKLEHGASYTDWMNPWDVPNAGLIPEEELARDYAVQRNCYAVNTATQQYWVKDSEHPYTTPEDKPFWWIRGYHLGGRSIMWGRQTYRMSEMDFEANARDGHGSDWPIRYADLAPWYDHIERFIGVSGSKEGLPQLPDGEFLPAMPMNDGEKAFKSAVERNYPDRKVIIGRCAHLTEAREHHTELGRNPCQYRSLCERGCSYGAYHSSLSSSLPAAEATGNLTIVTDAIAHSIITDPRTGKATGVRVIDQNTREGRTYEAKVVFLCASTIPTAQILLNSRSEANPRGLANSSDMVGRNLMDHLYGLGYAARMPGPETTFRGRRPNGLYIPRYRNLPGAGDTAGFLRGYGFQGAVDRSPWRAVANAAPGVGAELKERVRHPGEWMTYFSGFGEMLPNPENRVTLHATNVDKWGMPIAHIDCAHGENDRKMAQAILADGKAMIEAAGGQIVMARTDLVPPGLGIHEMGTACMGKDPKTSVLNKYNQAHDVPNLFVTDGAAMASGGCQNPSLTYMALSARAAHHATEFLKAGTI
ncbi:glucose-methanol-choline oxidoreductase [Novosphingobium aromaticivorans DSM 12444]|uniref:Glucose-methanol-choline oxidoreductase n=1 Tax=Novosphingobium aromaticivorans (strain ATCC 700278 / DSM 12444 / CCUG 56034 / CIP 105152 / NBRC 16084 / F199) TaxID=279238 RepID=Q2G3H4_NOVAD|nr:GMC family oxidoreductase [Novosphingobium aromaticivorans]ABD27599.1 glucose-methanol-choline oxidoreductase [Novosphingobium aromaticivorans DSM 12444]SCY72228.1 Choline dehydrogenase [Novosphingobium aromaticivorans]